MAAIGHFKISGDTPEEIEKKLDEMLLKLNLTRDDILITNIGNGANSYTFISKNDVVPKGDA